VVHCFLNGEPFDIAANITMTNNGGSADVVSPFGKTWARSSTQTITCPPSKKLSQTEITVLFCGLNPPSNINNAIAGGLNGASSVVQIGRVFSSGQSGFVVIGSSSLVAATPASYAQQPTVAVMRWSSGGPLEGWIRSIFGGSIQFVTSGSTLSGSLVAYTAFGSYNTGSFSAKIALLAIWNAALSEKECTSLLHNPYQFLA